MDLAGRLADAVAGLDRDRVLVGIDGPDAAGMTTLADRLAGALPGVVLRVSADDFLQPRQVRYARGALSPEGYYRDSLDLPRLVECLRRFRDGDPMAGGTAPPARAVLIADGIFLHRPELASFWTVSVYLAVSETETLARARRSEVDPERLAHVLVDNDDVPAPRILRWSLPVAA